MFRLKSHLWPVCAVCRLRVSFCVSFEAKKPVFFVVLFHQRHVFYGVLEASGPPTGAFWCPKGTYFTSFSSRCLAFAKMRGNHRILLCFLNRKQRSLLFFTLNFGRMSRLKSHLWPACRLILKLCSFHLQILMNVSAKIAPLAGLPPHHQNLLFSPSTFAECFG